MSVLLRKGEQTRQKIIRKAAPVFNQRGYSGTSLSELMEETGLEKGGIYRHFESKEELAVAAFDYAWQEIKRVRLGALDAIPSPLGKLHRMVDMFASKPSVVPGGCALMNTAIDADDGNPTLRAHARKAMREWLGYLETAVRLGIEQGEILPETMPSEIASLIISTLEGSLMISRLIGNETPLCFARRHLHSMLDDIAA
ncbi:MAG TPA: TetR/AcrR family transcriptional regulator [Alloacidobacterium sp.]|nr:TetR/AcrR family transcriptional regulator [Alloacidobacterium sp.]